MNGSINWLERHLLPCPFKWLTGLDCPGCGLQRSFIALLRGHLRESWHLFPALLPLLFTMLLLLLHLKFRFTNGARYIRYSCIATTGIVMVSYILKMIR